MPTLSRRHLLAGFLAAGVEARRDARDQSPRLIKIGALTESWGPTPALVGVRDGLRELGYREDTDFTIGVRFTQGNAAELPAAARDLVRHRVDLIVSSDSGATTKAAQKCDADEILPLRLLSSNISGFILESAMRGVLPTMFHIPFFVERGGLASYSADPHELGKQAARLVDKILKGARPAELPARAVRGRVARPMDRPRPTRPRRRRRGNLPARARALHPDRELGPERTPVKSRPQPWHADCHRLQRLQRIRTGEGGR
jgi:ABC-type uncharacterized transport system substrate-binding protein